MSEDSRGDPPPPLSHLSLRLSHACSCAAAPCLCALACGGFLQSSWALCHSFLLNLNACIPLWLHLTRTETAIKSLINFSSASRWRLPVGVVSVRAQKCHLFHQFSLKNPAVPYLQYKLPRPKSRTFEPSSYISVASKGLFIDSRVQLVF